MGVLCQILINKPREGVHRAGQPVTGIVKYRVDDPTEFKDVTLSFLGRGKCHWTESNMDRDKSDDHYYGKEDYIVHFINICNKKQNATITLHGDYQYPFELFLPEDIPRSFKDTTGSITYTIELKFVKTSLFSFNKVFTAEVPVYNYVTARAEGPVIFGLDKKFTSLFSTKTPNINLKAEINKTCLTPGENAHITYTLINDTNTMINSIRAELYCYTTYTADCGHTKIVNEKVKSCEVETMSIREKSTFKYSCILPTRPELYSIENSKVIKKEYKVKVTVRLPIPHKNAVVEMPVVIGDQKPNVDTADEALEGGGEPPSYWEAVCEEKEEKS